MNILVLLATSLLALIFLIIHSYLFRGIRLTINFFTFAFIWAFMKETVACLHLTHRSPLYKLMDNRIPIIFRALIPTIGWLFTFYLGWCLAERVIKRVKYFQHSLFATLLLSMIIIASISYCVEVPAIGLGWWRWTENINYMSNFVVGMPFFALDAWGLFSTYFLLAFFLIECSKFKKTDWKSVFFIIYFIHFCANKFIGPRLLIANNRFIVGLIFILSLVCSLKLEYYFQEQMPIKRFKFNRNTLQILDKIPIFVSIFMLLIVIIIDLGILRKPGLLISCLPIIFFILLVIDKIPLRWLVFVVFGLILTFEKKFIITTIPVITILIFQAFSWIKEKSNVFKEVI